MKKITAKYINDNLNEMAYEGKRVTHNGAIYWMVCDWTEDYKRDPKNGTLYWISRDRNILGAINGHEYGKVIDGVAYRQ